MNPFFIGISGGSGSGKTALARELAKIIGQQAIIFYLDDYQKFEGSLPEKNGMKIWDSPHSIDIEKFYKDLKKLKQGKEIIVRRRDQRTLNKNKYKEVRVIPTEIIIIEGNLLFFDSRIRKFLNMRIFLKANDRVRIKRRTKFKNERYIREILLPMHYTYVESTKKYANKIFNSGKINVREIAKKVLNDVPKYILINP